MWPFNKKKVVIVKEDNNEVEVPIDILASLCIAQVSDFYEQEEERSRQERINREFAINLPIPEQYKKYVIPKSYNSCYLKIGKLKQINIVKNPDGIVVYSVERGESVKYYLRPTQFETFDEALKFILRDVSITSTIS